jgi:hypothetical protein
MNRPFAVAERAGQNNHFIGDGIMANGVQSASMAGTRVSARQVFGQKELGFVKRGLATALGSGMLWGLDGVILGIALAMAPFTAGATMYAAPLAGSALHDGFAGLWLAIYNLFTGRWKDIGRSLKTFPGFIVCVAALLGGPIGLCDGDLGRLSRCRRHHGPPDSQGENQPSRLVRHYYLCGRCGYSRLRSARRRHHA